MHEKLTGWRITERNFVSITKSIIPATNLSGSFIKLERKVLMAYRESCPFLKWFAAIYERSCKICAVLSSILDGGGQFPTKVISLISLTVQKPPFPRMSPSSSSTHIFYKIFAKGDKIGVSESYPVYFRNTCMHRSKDVFLHNMSIWPNVSFS